MQFRGGKVVYFRNYIDAVEVMKVSGGAVVGVEDLDRGRRSEGLAVEPEFAYAKSRGLSVAYAVLGEGPLDLVVVPGFVSHLEAALEHPVIASSVEQAGLVCPGDHLRQARDRPV